MRILLCLALMSLALATPASAEDELIRYRMPNGSIGFAQDISMVPPGAVILRDPSRSADRPNVQVFDKQAPPAAAGSAGEPAKPAAATPTPAAKPAPATRAPQPSPQPAQESAQPSWRESRQKMLELESQLTEVEARYAEACSRRCRSGQCGDMVDCGRAREEFERTRTELGELAAKEGLSSDIERIRELREKKQAACTGHTNTSGEHELDDPWACETATDALERARE